MRDPVPPEHDHDQAHDQTHDYDYDVTERRRWRLEQVVRLGRPAGLVPAKPTPIQIGLLIGIVVLSLGPIVALAFAVSQDDDPVKPLLRSATTPPDGAHVRATITEVNPTNGELRMRLLVEPQPDLLEDGRPTEDLSLIVNDLRGDDTYLFPAGEPVRPVEVVLGLTGGSVSSYPFDDYQSMLTVAVLAQRPDDDEPLLLTVDVSSNVYGFDASAAPGGSAAGEELSQPVGLALVELTAGREATTSVYAVGIMMLMWALAIVGVGIVWAVVIWQVEVPWWAMGYFVGVLFALPQLRESMPGRPPPGTLLDYVAFYWVIATLGASLIVVMSIWISRTRQDHDAVVREAEAELAAPGDDPPKGSG